MWAALVTADESIVYTFQTEEEARDWVSEFVPATVEVTLTPSGDWGPWAVLRDRSSWRTRPRVEVGPEQAAGSSRWCVYCGPPEMAGHDCPYAGTSMIP